MVQGLSLTETAVEGSHAPGVVWLAVVLVDGGQMLRRLEMGMWMRV